MLTDSTCRMNINILLKVFHGRRVTCHIGTNRQIKSTQQKKNDHNIGFDFHGELNQFHVLPKEIVGRVMACWLRCYSMTKKNITINKMMIKKDGNKRIRQCISIYNKTKKKNEKLVRVNSSCVRVKEQIKPTFGEGVQDR